MLLAGLAVAAHAACSGSGSIDRAAQASVPNDPACAEVRKLRGPARDQVMALARLLAIRPAMAMNMSKASDESCLSPGSRVMTHFAARPGEATRDIVYYVDAAPLVAKGLRLEAFPAIDPTRDRMLPDTWYRFTGKEAVAHHGHAMYDGTWLVLAVDVK
jgi:hypothetical protein